MKALNVNIPFLLADKFVFSSRKKNPARAKFRSSGAEQSDFAYFNARSNFSFHSCFASASTKEIALCKSCALIWFQILPAVFGIIGNYWPESSCF